MIKVPEILTTAPFSHPQNLDVRTEKRTFSVVYDGKGTPERLGQIIPFPDLPDIQPITDQWMIPPYPNERVIVKINVSKGMREIRELQTLHKLNQLFTPDAKARHALLYGYGVTKTEETDRLYLVIEEATDGFVSFADIIWDQTYKIDPDKAITACRVFADFFATIHTAGIAHGDIFESGLVHGLWNEENEQLRVIDWNEAALKDDKLHLPGRYIKNIANDQLAVWNLFQGTLVNSHDYSSALIKKYPAPVAELMLQMYDKRRIEAYVANEMGTQKYAQDIRAIEKEIKGS